MNYKTLIKKVLTLGCVCFSIITALYALVVAVMTVDGPRVLLDAKRILMFFVFSLLFAFASGALKLEGLHGAIRYSVHYILITFGFYACMILPADMTPSNTAVGIALFTLLYLIIMAVRALFRARLRANLEKTESYQSQFKKGKK